MAGNVGMSDRSTDADAAEAAAPDAREAVRRALALDVVLGRLRPRERLVEDDLMTRFGAKRHLVRSALADLERSGLIERRPNRGAIVREYSSDEIEQLYEFRADLHSLAVTRMTLPLPGRVIETLEAISEAHEAAVARGALADVILHNDRFHDCLFDQCGNPFIAQAIHRLGDAATAIRSYRVNDPRLLAQAVDEHREMIGAARQGDRSLLHDLVMRHILPSKTLYLRDLGHAGDLGARAATPTTT